jgi:hypothetical protein
MCRYLVKQHNYDSDVPNVSNRLDWYAKRVQIGWSRTHLTPALISKIPALYLPATPIQLVKYIIPRLESCPVSVSILKLTCPFERKMRGGVIESSQPHSSRGGLLESGDAVDVTNGSLS